MTNSFHKKEVIHVARYMIFLILVAISCVAINIQTVAVNISNLSVTKNGYPKIAILLNAFRSVLGAVQPVHIIAAIALIWLFYNTILSKEAKFYISAFITGGIFSLCLLISSSFSKYEDFSFINQSKYQMVIAATFLIGYWGIFYSAISMLLAWLDSFEFTYKDSTKIAYWIDKHFFVISLVVILLCWLPYCIVYFPGSLPHDAQYQLNQFYGISHLSNQHPITGTLIMGAIVKLGDLIISKDFGVTLYMTFQSIVCAIVFAYICTYIRKKKMPLAFSLGCVIFYAIVPTWGAYAQSVIKDTLYYGMFSWFVLEYIKFILGDSGKYSTLKLSISAVLVCLLRSEGIFIVFVALIVLLIILKINRKKICITLLITLLAGVGVNNVLVNVMEITSVSTKESMSIPFSQMARYVRDCEDNLTNDEIEIINAILNYENLVDAYDPELADGVKGLYHSNATDEDWAAFWKLWAKKLIERPDIFFEAAINQSYGYFDPFYFYAGMSVYQTYIKGPITSNEKEPVYATYIFSDGIRNSFDQYISGWQKIPILSLFVNCGAYTWAGILLIALTLRKKNWHETTVFLIPAMVVFLCCLSPVNGLLRYMLPVMASIPLYAFIGLKSYLLPKNCNVASEKLE